MRWKGYGRRMRELASSPQIRPFGLLALMGGVLCALLAGAWMMDFNSVAADEQFGEVMTKRFNEARFVRVDDFIARYAPGEKHVRPQDAARIEIEQRKAAGNIPFWIGTDRLVSKWLDLPEFQDADAGMNARYARGIGVIVGEWCEPSALAHEILGHGAQAQEADQNGIANDYAPAHELWYALTGRQQRFEQDAWDRARRSGYPVDPIIEEASMATYRDAHTGAVIGGIAGFIVGTVLGVFVLLFTLAVISEHRDWTDGPWRVVVVNDDHNTFADVELWLVAVTGCLPGRAHLIAQEIHSKGAAVAYRGSKERCDEVMRAFESFRLGARVLPRESPND